MGSGDRIAITSIGLVCSVGLDAASSLAAICCDITNFSSHESVLVHADYECTELDGATIARLPKTLIDIGSHGAARAATLLAPAIREATAGLPRTLTESAQWRLQGGAGIDNDDLMNLLAEQGVLPRSPATPLNPVEPALGRCHFFENLMQAATDLLNGNAPMAIVGCVDSLCDDPILQALADADVLKSSTNPEGFVAGEAAGVFVLERESDTRRRNGLALAYIAATGRGSESSSLSKGTRSTAKVLQEAFTEAFADLPRNGRAEGDVFDILEFLPPDDLE